MTNRRWIYLIIALLALASTDSVLARRGHGGHHHHHHIGGHHHHGGHGHLRLGINMGGYYNPGFFGAGVYNPGAYGYRSYGYPNQFLNVPAYSYPPTVVAPVTPPVYIQQEQPRPVQTQANYWHYCQKPEGYYPYVRSCPGGWLQVAPQPAAQ